MQKKGNFCSLQNEMDNDKMRGILRERMSIINIYTERQNGNHFTESEQL